jgi:hypothetical protein
MKWHPALTAIATVIVGSAQIWVVTDFLYTRREADIEIRRLDAHHVAIAAEHLEMKREMVAELKELNSKVSSMRAKLDLYLRAQQEVRDHLLSLKTPRHYKQGG